MNSYLQLKVEGASDSTYKKLRVLFGSGSYPYSMDQGRNVYRDWTGAMILRFGPNYKFWYGKFRVKTTEDSGYATRADLELWHNSNTPADHKLVMRMHSYDVTAVTYNVSFVTGTDPQGQIPMMESSGGYALMDFKLESR